MLFRLEYYKCVSRRSLQKQTYRLYISNQMLVHLPKLIYTPKWLYESRDFNHIKSSFESVRVCYYLRECVEVIALFCCTAPRLSNYPCMWRLELNIFWHLASFKCMTIIHASHVIIFYQGCYSSLAIYFHIDSIYESLWTMSFRYSRITARFLSTWTSWRAELCACVDVKPYLVTRRCW